LLLYVFLEEKEIGSGRFKENDYEKNYLVINPCDPEPTLSCKQLNEKIVHFVTLFIATVRAAAIYFI